MGILPSHTCRIVIVFNATLQSRVHMHTYGDGHLILIPAMLFHLVPPSSPTMTISPLGLVSIGTNATLTCNPGDGVGGATIRVYQWSKGGVVLQDRGRVSGSAQATLRITSANLEDQGSYRCTVTNVDGVSVASGSAQLNVTGKEVGGNQLGGASELIAGAWSGEVGVAS